ncbi:MAG: ribokinase [Armatimonadota bacterium]|nr:ribokinase [Armatimonadota bacterium]
MAKRPKIVVVGSSNTDMVVKTERIPAPGETVIGGEFVTAAGGKGANQAVAASRLGADVTFVARIGRDVLGDQAVENFKREGIDTSFIVRDDGAPSGVALIFVDKHGENSIVVASGSNGRLSPEDVDRAAERIRTADAVVMQLEAPVETVARAAEIAHKAGVRVILNPAPAGNVPMETLAKVDVLTPNESEAAHLAGTANLDVEDLGRKLLEIGVGAVILTLGSKGALLIDRSGSKGFAAPKVEPVDTTAAGDAFTGALACALAEGKSMDDAIVFASQAAAISVTRMGAQPSLPMRKELSIDG